MRTPTVKLLQDQATVRLSKPPLRGVRGPGWSALLAGFGLASALVAEPLPLPVEMPLDGETVVLELQYADVTVTVDESAEPVLTARMPPDTEFPDVGEVELLPAAGGLGFKVTGHEEVAVRVALTISPSQRLLARGTNVDLSIVAPDAAPVADAVGGTPVASEGGVVRFDLSLEASEADLTGIENVELHASSSSLWLRDTRGRLKIDLQQGRVEIRGHHGDVTFAARDAASVLLDPDGAVSVQLTGGSFQINDGAGRLDGVARDTDLLVAGWTGELAIVAGGGRFEARSTEHFEKPWRIEGHDLRAFLDQIRGPLDVKVKGGTFECTGVEGPVTFLAQESAEIDGSDFAAGVRLKLLDGAEARLSGIAMLAQVEAEDASLRIENVGTLTLTASRSRITVGGVENLRNLSVTDSDVDLDLTATSRIPRLDLQGTGRASVVLQTPCIVRPELRDPSRSDQIWVTSCDLRLAGQAVHSTRSHLIYGHRQPSILTLALGDGMEVTVEGRTTE